MGSTRQIVCAASALAAGILSASAGWGAYVKELTTQQDFSRAYSNCISFSEELGGMTLSESVNAVPYLWVPNPATNTVSKMDARTGQELARYNIGRGDEGWTPCAVATDYEGNAYIACAAYGSTGKVVRIAMADGVDKNNSGLITTSGDANGDSMITPAEVLPWGKDERVTAVYEVGGIDSVPSSLFFDTNGSLWVTLWGDRSASRINLSTGKVDATVALMGRPSNAVVDQRGVIWILSRDNKTLCMVNPITCVLEDYYTLDKDSEPSGMCIDANGKIWISDSIAGMIGFQTTTGTWDWYGTGDGYGYSSVTVDINGDIWATCPSENIVVHFLADDVSMVSTIDVGPNPGSISVDADGYIWTLNEGNGTASRINASEDKRVATALIAGAPFSSTSFTTSIVKKGVSQSGTWNTVLDTSIDGAGWGKISWLSDERMGAIKFEARSSDSMETLIANQFKPVTNGDDLNLSCGRYIEIKATFDGSMGASPVLQSLLVEGRNLAPDVSKAMPTIASLKNKDHAMEAIGIKGVVDTEGDPVSIEIIKVAQNEPVMGLSKDDKPVDAIGVGAERVWLRGECDMSANAKGRVYLVTFKATDSEGASSTGKVKVYVPKDETLSEIALNESKLYDSSFDPNMKQIACR